MAPLLVRVLPLLVAVLLQRAGVAQAETCAEDHFVNSSACIPCSVGRANPAGDDTTAGDTNCTDIDGCVGAADDAHTCNGFCFDDSDYAHSSFTCEFFFVNAYCANGGAGPAWDAAWSFDDYANPDNGLSPLDACCDCGGGAGLYNNDSDRDAVCVDVPAPGTGFNCSCSPGWAFDVALRSCRPVVCAADFRVQDSTCVPCLPGKAHAAGTAAIYGDTACFNRTCAFNEHVSNHTCTPCAPGYTNAAGDNAFGTDTACEVWVCAEDERVLNGSCVGCSYGGVRAAGDNASLLNNTECFFDTCELNQYVVDGACADCPPGTFMNERLRTWARGVNCTPDFCPLHHYVSNHTCVPCGNRSGYPLYNPAHADRSGPDTACGVYCLIDDLPLPHAAYLVTDRDEFPEAMVPIGEAAALNCDLEVSFVESGAPHNVVCTYAAAFMAYDATPQLVCGDRDFCEGNDLCATTWGDDAAACVDRAVPAAGYDCACNRTGFSSRTLRVNDPFDASFQQNFTAAMEAVEGDRGDVVVACAYTVCARDAHVANGTCTPCVPGSVRPAGDRSHRGSTDCEHVVCAVDERVANHTCAPCNTAAGFFNARRDDSTGPDTSCAPRLCTGRYRVGGHDCVECPAGQFNPHANYSDQGDGGCVEFDACAAFTLADVALPTAHVFTTTMAAAETTRAALGLPADPNATAVTTTMTTTTTTTTAAITRLPCRENGDLGAACVDHRAPDVNRSCYCSPGWQNVSRVTLPGRTPYEYNASWLVASAFAAAGSPGDAWGQFASEPFFTSAVGYTTCLPQLCRYDEYVHNHACVPCAPGTTRAAGDDASVPPELGGDTACTVVVCGEDEFVVNHTYAAEAGLDNVDYCQQCAPGSTRPAGDLATRSEGTACAPTICGAGKQVLDHACVACAPGTRNPLGGFNAMRHENLECEHVLCAEDEYVLAHACFACAPGTVNEAGDDAAGSKTACDEVICEKNHYVLPFHVCAPCEVGTTRDAGDMASRDATACHRCSDVIDAACVECDSKVDCTACAPGYHLVLDEERGVVTCAPTVCGVDEHVVNYECVPCDANKTNAGGDFAPLNATDCDEVFTVEFNDTYARCSLTEACELQVALTYAPLANVTVHFDAAPSSSAATATTAVTARGRGRELATAAAAALSFEPDTQTLLFTPQDYHETRRVAFALNDPALCSNRTGDDADGDEAFPSTYVRVTLTSADPHYNSSANVDPAAVAGHTVRVRCYARPRVSGFSPPASHMQGGERVSVLGDGLRDDLSVWFASDNDLPSTPPAACGDVRVVSDTEARCTLPSSQFGFSAALLQVRTAADVLEVNSSDAADNGGAAAKMFFERRCVRSNDLVVLTEAGAAFPGSPRQEVCLPCSVRSFSPYGIRCAACPNGTECVALQEELEGTFVAGSAVPAQLPRQFRERHDPDVYGQANLTFYNQPVGGGGCETVDPADGLSCDDLVLRSGGAVYCHALEAAGRDCGGCVCGAAVHQLAYHSSSGGADCIDGDFDFVARPVMECGWPADRCEGGSACAAGYRNHSWLCAGCDAGFAPYRGQCWSCTAGVARGWLYPPTVNVLVAGAVLLLFVGGLAFNRHHLAASLRDLKKLQTGRPGAGAGAGSGDKGAGESGTGSGSQQLKKQEQAAPATASAGTQAGGGGGAGANKRRPRAAQVVPIDAAAAGAAEEGRGALERDVESGELRPRKQKQPPDESKSSGAAGVSGEPAAPRGEGKQATGKAEPEVAETEAEAAARQKTAAEYRKLQAKLLQLGGRAWAKYLDPRDAARYDVMRLRLVVQLKAKIAERLRWTSVVFKMLVTTAQLIGGMNALVGIRPLVWPLVFSSFVYAFEWVDLHAYMLPSFGCLAPLPPLGSAANSSSSAAAEGVQESFAAVLLHPDVQYYRTLAASVLLPAVLMAVVGLASLCQAGTRRVSAAERLAREKEAERLRLPPPLSEKAAAQRQARWTGGLYILLFFYVPVSRTALEVFSCDLYEETYWLTADPSTQCYTVPYWGALCVAVLVLVLFSALAPALVLRTVHANKATLGTPETSRWLGFVYFEYRAGLHLWDAVEYAQRFLLLACVPGLTARASPWQPVLSLGVALAFFVAHARARPYRAAYLNRVKAAVQLAVLLNYFWTCLLVLLPTVMGVDVAGVVEAGPAAFGGSYVEYYEAAWAGREAVARVFDVVLVLPNIFAVVYVVLSEQVEGCSRACQRAAKRQAIMTAERRRLRREQKELELKPWARPSKQAVAKFEAALAAVDLGGGGGAAAEEEGNVGAVVETRGTQTDPEQSFEESMAALKQENVALFEKGRALQAQYRNLAKKLATAREEAGNVAPDLEWRRQKVEDLRAELAAVEARNEKLAFKKRKQAVVRHSEVHADMLTEQHDEI